MPLRMMSSKAQEAGFNFIDTNTPNERSWTSGTFTEQLEEPPEYVSTLPRSINQPVPRPVGAIASGLEFADYHLPLSTVSEDKTTSTTTASQLTGDPHVLYEFLQNQFKMPPRPVVRLLGTHADWCYSWGNTKVDFDLMLDIMPLIYPAASPNDAAPLANYSTELENLATQVKNFCHQDGDCKVFMFERRVTGWDTDFLEQKIRALVQSTKYRGDVTVTFPITNARVQVLKDSTIDVLNDRSQRSTKSKWYKRSKPNEDKLSEEEQVMRALVQAHKHGNICVDWLYSKDDNGPRSQDNPTTPFSSKRRYTAQSEQDWWAVWEGPIKNCVLRGRQCWVTLEDWKDVVMGHLQLEVPARTWGTSSDDWAAFVRSSKWSDKQAARQYLREAGLRTESGSRHWHLAGVGGF